MGKGRENLREVRLEGRVLIEERTEGNETMQYTDRVDLDGTDGKEG